MKHKIASPASEHKEVDVQADALPAGKYLPLAFAGAFAVLAVAIWIPLGGSDDARPDNRQNADNSATTQMIANTLAEGSASLTNRPLFHITRRPPAVAQPVAAPKVTLSLAGILNDEGREIALLRLSNSSELVRKRPGDRIGEWVIKSITPTEVTVTTKDGEDQVMRLGAASQ